MIARLAGPEATGEYVFTILIASALGVVLEFGGGKGAVRAAAAGRRWEEVVGNRQRYATAAGLMGVLVAASVYSQRLDVALFGLAISIGGLLALSAIAEGALLGIGAGGAAAIGNLLFNVLAFSGAFIVLLKVRTGVALWLVLSYWLGAAVAVAFYEVALRRRFGRSLVMLRPDRSASLSAENFQLRSERRHVVMIGGLAILSLLYFRMDVILLSVLVPRSSLAIYAAAYRLLEVGIIGIQIVAAARQPKIAGTSSSPERETVCDATFVAAVLLAGCFATAAGLAGPVVVEKLLGPDYLAGQRVLVLLCPGLIGLALQVATGVYIAGYTELVRSWHFIFSLSIVNVIGGGTLSAVGYLIGDLYGLATAQSITELALGWAVMALVLTRLHLPVPPVASAGTAAAALCLALIVLSSFVALTIAVALGFCVGCALWKRDSVREVVLRW